MVDTRVQVYRPRPAPSYEVHANGEVYSSADDSKPVDKIQVHAGEKFQVKLPLGGVLGRNAFLNEKETSPWIELQWVKVKYHRSSPEDGAKIFEFKTNPAKMTDPTTGNYVTGSLAFDTLEMPKVKVQVQVFTGARPA